MMTKKVISWQKWRNPYKPPQKKDKDSDDDGYLKNSNIDVDNDDDNDDDNSTEGQNLILFTPIGPVPLNDSNDPEKIFNFWVGHTNFNISKPIKKIINKIEGVEILNIYTRYRFRVGIGNLFQTQAVITSINRKISEYFREKTPNEEQQESCPGPTVSNT